MVTRLEQMFSTSSRTSGTSSRSNAGLRATSMAATVAVSSTDSGRAARSARQLQGTHKILNKTVHGTNRELEKVIYVCANIINGWAGICFIKDKYLTHLSTKRIFLPAVMDVA
jgi:hypothetical protein